MKCYLQLWRCFSRCYSTHVLSGEEVLLQSCISVLLKHSLHLFNTCSVRRRRSVICSPRSYSNTLSISLNTCSVCRPGCASVTIRLTQHIPEAYVYAREKIRWTRAKRHTADSCFELVGSHQRSPAQFTLGSMYICTHIMRLDPSFRALC